jgi:hypothetical protein
VLQCCWQLLQAVMGQVEGRQAGQVLQAMWKLREGVVVCSSGSR